MNTYRWLILRLDKKLGLRLVTAFDVEHDPLPGLIAALNDMPEHRQKDGLYALVIAPDRHVELVKVEPNPVVVSLQKA